MNPEPSPLEQLVRTMSIEELSNRSGRSIEQIVDYALGNASSSSASRRSPPTKVSRARKSGAPKRTASTSKVDTRTAEGRDAYDEAVLGVIKNADHPISANEIRAEVGGTPIQLRAAVKRLEESRQIKTRGKARGTRYTGR